MKLVALSDTHERHRQIDVPDGDILVFAGDFTMTGELNAVRDFTRWLDRLPHDHKLVIGGNHDCCFTGRRRSKALDILFDVDGLIYAEDTLDVVQGTGFYCTPWTISFNEWCLQKDEDGLRVKFQQIPETTEVLITHGPAHGTGDWLDGYGHIGSKALKDAMTVFSLISTSTGTSTSSMGNRRTAVTT